MDDDSQNPPDQILKLLDEITNSKVDLVVGVYKERKHTAFRLISSKLMNFLIKKVFKAPKNFKSSNFRLLSRSLINRIINSNPDFPYTTGQALKFASSIRNIQVKHKVV